MGSLESIDLDNLTKDIQNCSLNKNVWVTAISIPGAKNVETDDESRLEEQRSKQMLNKETFEEILNDLKIDSRIDLFSSRLNFQKICILQVRSTVYYSQYFFWKNQQFLCPPLPPFEVIARVIQKMIKGKATGILIVTDWPNWHWYNLIKKVPISDIFIPPRMDLFQLPET